MVERDLVEEATRVLLAEAGPHGEFGRVARDPQTGERSLVFAVRGNALDDLLCVVEQRRPTLLKRIGRSLASDD